MPTTIHPATPSDISVLVNMWQAIDTFTFTQREHPFGGDSEDKPFHAKQLLKRTLASPLAAVLKALDEHGVIIGTISGHVFEKSAVRINKIGVVYSLWVNEKYRRQGVGQQLLDHLEKALAKKGAQAFQVGWGTANITADYWWKKRGYCSYEIIASKILNRV